MKLKILVVKFFRLLGFNISKIKKPQDLTPFLFHHFNIDLLLDVGANSGQYSLLARRNGYSGSIISFEPLSSAHKKLIVNAKNDNYWKVYPRCGIGSSISELTINISKNSYSSSLLDILPSHTDAAPESKYIGKETVNIKTLDSLFDENLFNLHHKSIYLKIDTQGFEKEVLEGSLTSLQYIKCVELELSVILLYKNQNLYDFFFKFMRENGFELWTLSPGISDPKSGQLLQFDAIFFKK